jgi:hypothetical protein
MATKKKRQPTKGAVPIGPTLPIPVRATRIDPSGLGTADCRLVCRGDDGCDYAIKDPSLATVVPNSDGASIPHSEWFCTCLGELIGVRAPPCHVIEMPDGKLVFGSLWQGGVLENKTPWWDLVKSGAIALADIAPILSRIYAFDHFVHNIDRHLNNFLPIRQKNSVALLAYDYSRAWLVLGVPLPELLPSLPFDTTDPFEKTVKAQRELSSYLGAKYISADDVSALLKKVEKVTKTQIERIIVGHPAGWLTPIQRASIRKWWKSKAMKDRLQKIDGGIRNGSYL